MIINPKTVQCFVDGAGNKHESKLQYLISERRIQMRGIVQSDAQLGKNASFTATQIADIMISNAAAIADVSRSFNAAIKREREKSEKVAIVTILSR